jgi:hypothetical protein
MHWIGLLSLTAAAAVCVRWSMRRADALGRARSFPFWSVALLVVCGGAALMPWFLRMRLEGRLSAAASEVAGFEVDVHCQSFGEAFTDVGAEYGFVAFGPDGVPEHKTLIKRDQCSSLQDYLRSDKTSPTREEVVAVHVLTHETIHMMGVTSEAETECLAVQNDATMAEELGASPGAARSLADSYWLAVYPRMPDEYRSLECAGPAGSADRPPRTH